MPLIMSAVRSKESSGSNAVNCKSPIFPRAVTHRGSQKKAVSELLLA